MELFSGNKRRVMTDQPQACSPMIAANSWKAAICPVGFWRSCHDIQRSLA